MATQQATKSLFDGSTASKLREQIKQLSSHCFEQFKKLERSYIFLHIFFITLLAALAITFCGSLVLLLQASLLALALAALLTTGFAYLILLFYFQTKKPQQLDQLRTDYFKACHLLLPAHLSLNERHLAIAHAAYQFTLFLDQEQIKLSQPLREGKRLTRIISLFSNCCYRKDLYKLKELFLLHSVEEHVALIRRAPTDVETHASLANTYINLAYLYKSQALKRSLQKAKQQFEIATKRAIQEFKIIDHYSPNEPWVYAKLAACYHHLNMYPEEIAACEYILKLSPRDKHLLLRLGKLYFRQGANAQGLQIYHTLKQLKFSRAKELIDQYESSLDHELRLVPIS